MPRVSKEVREIAEKNAATMKEAPVFDYWVFKYFKAKVSAARMDSYRKAYDLVNKPEVEENVQEDS